MVNDFKPSAHHLGSMSVDFIVACYIQVVYLNYFLCCTGEFVLGFWAKPKEQFQCVDLHIFIHIFLQWCFRAKFWKNNWIKVMIERSNDWVWTWKLSCYFSCHKNPFFLPLSSWSQLFFFSLQYVVVVKHVFLYNKHSVFFLKQFF